MKRRIIANLAYIGRSREWLAQQLGMSPSTLQRRLDDVGSFQLRELQAMQRIFKWKTLDGSER